MTQEQRIGLLKNQLTSNPAATSAEEVYDENGDVILDQLVGFTEDSESYNAQEVLDNYVRSGVIRQYTDTETGALFNNALNMLAEYVGAVNGEVTIPYMLISNPMLSGHPYEIGFAAAVAATWKYRPALQAWAETRGYHLGRQGHPPDVRPPDRPGHRPPLDPQQHHVRRGSGAHG